MTVSKIHLSFAGKELCLGLHFAETERFFRSYGILPSGGGDLKQICADPEVIRECAAESGGTDGYAEYFSLALEVGNELTHFARIIFHGVAFIHGGGAYILTAPSGTGKSTQYRNLRTLFGNEYQIINGDKPVLALDKAGRIWACPSPWNGKEGWRGKRGAPLQGIVLLSQGDRNRLFLPEREEAVLQLMKQVLFSAPDRASVRTVCGYIDKMVTSLPLYGFVNRGDEESSRMLDRLFHDLEKAGHEVQGS